MIPFLDLKAQMAPLRDDVAAAIGGVLDSCEFVLGKEVARFERDFAAYCNVEHAVGVNTGTSALHVALLAAGIGAGDEVITTPMTFVATTAAICYVGAKPVFVDVDDRTWMIEAGAVAAAITPRTKAILPVHLHGLMADMGPLCEVAAQHDLTLIEDACQSHGATCEGRRAGGFGRIGCFSFYPGKNLGAYGEGGAAVTNDAALARTMRLLRDWGQDRRYNHVLKAFNYRMDGIQGAILNVKLPHLEAWNESRRRIAAIYRGRLADAGIGLPAEPADRRHIYHVFAIRVRRRDEVQRRLGDLGIGTNIHYPVPVHLQPAYADLGYRRGDFPVAERLGDEFLSLPIYAEMRDDDAHAVCDAVLAAVGG